jgi:hypothetical protein
MMFTLAKTCSELLKLIRFVRRKLRAYLGKISLDVENEVEMQLEC